MQNKDADLYIKELELIPHPEGGFFKEIYRSAEVFKPQGYNSQRNYLTSIYFLLRSGEFSSFHRLLSDEIWYYHAGAPVKIFIIDEAGKLNNFKLGADIASGQKLQVIFPKGVWFAAEPETENSYSLFGCAVAPGFNFEDFELGSKEKLISKFPEHHDLIRKFSIC